MIGTSAIARDMTERHRAEERLRLLARALESTNEMVSVTDADDRFTFVNAAFLRAYGYAAEDVIGQTPALLQSRQTPDAVSQDDRRASRGATAGAGELLNRRRDGTEFFVSLNTSAVRDDRGQIVGLLGVARDITERLRSERALQDAEERMRFALEASHVGVWEANLRTGAGFWSTTCEAMHGLAPGTFGRTYEAFLDHVHPDDRADARQRVARAIRTARAGRDGIPDGLAGRHGPPHQPHRPLHVRRTPASRCAPPASPSTSPSAARSRSSCGSRRRWTRSASSPAASPTISTIC